LGLSWVGSLFTSVQKYAWVGLGQGPSPIGKVFKTSTYQAETTIVVEVSLESREYIPGCEITSQRSIESPISMKRDIIPEIKKKKLATFSLKC